MDKSFLVGKKKCSLLNKILYLCLVFLLNNDIIELIMEKLGLKCLIFSDLVRYGRGRTWKAFFI